MPDDQDTAAMCGTLSKDHPWRYMPNNAMTPHISGTTIDGQVSTQ